jgi:hypothetical protein
VEPQLAALVTARVGEAEFTRGVSNGVTKGIFYTLASLAAFFIVSNVLLSNQKEKEQNLQSNYTGY